MTYSKAFPLLLIWLCPGCADGCVLDDDLRLFAGDTARDCGRVAAGGDRADVDACVAEAFDASEPFIARYESVGMLSKVVSAVASNTAGQIKLFQWDSAPCGGSGCSAVTDVQSCEGPAVTEQSSEDPLALPITCDRVGLPERVCG